MAITSNPSGNLDMAQGGSASGTWASGRLRPAALVRSVLLLFSTCFFALHFIHLSADFPNFSRWMDWSKYTDEGWYGDAAIRHFQLGHWYVPGDFNPAVALPVWPLLEAFLFRVTGVSLIAARVLAVSVFGGILLASWRLIRDSEPGANLQWDLRVQAGSAKFDRRSSLAAPVALVLLATNPFCFVFTRLAILEPLLVLLTLLALVVAQRARIVNASAIGYSSGLLSANRNVILGLGVSLVLLILTKTTGIFLIPAVAWMLFASVGYRFRPLLRVGGTAAALAIALWLSYFFICVRPHYLLDYQYLFSANAYTRITRATFFSVLVSTFEDGKWFGIPLFACAVASAMLALFQWRHLRRHPLIVTLLLWALGYTAFLAYHDNLQPRYYLVVAVPLTLLVPVAFRDLIIPRLHNARAIRSAYVLACLALACVVIPDVAQTLSIVRHPQYTLLFAARQVRDYIARDTRKRSAHSQLVLSISGSDLSLMTGLHSICDDFGTSELADRVKQYNPGWYAAWNLIEDDKMDALSPSFQVTRVASFPAMDDSDRNILVLYRLEPAGEEDEQRRRRRGRLSRNRVGQQPSHTQLKH